MSNPPVGPYIRPLELGAEDESLTIRVVQDGTRTTAEVYVGGKVEAWSKPIGVGGSVRRKGDRRDSTLGSKLAVARALQSASENIFAGVQDKLG